MKNINPFKYLLIPFSWIFGLIVYIRNLFFNLHILPEKSFNISVISVGNITVGGTGKTPMVEYLVTLLRNEFKLATLSRGYLRKTRGFILAGNNPSHLRIGDEPCQIKNKFPDIEVAVDTNRVNGIQKLMMLKKGIDLIILDDAFQHRYVKPGLSILLVDYNRPITGDKLLPFGSLRENASAKKRADIIIVSKAPLNITPDQRKSFVKNLEPLPGQHLFFSTIIYDGIKNVFKQHSSPDTEKLTISAPPVLMVCGIAVPSNLKSFVSGFSPDITELFFRDHHNYTAKDINSIQKTFREISGTGKIIITTEKDSVRLRQFDTIPDEIKRIMFYIPIRTIFLHEDGIIFNQLILDYARSH